MGKRGELTEEVQKVAKKAMGREISVRELRLMPYVQYTMMNSQRLEINKINQEEREILRKWKDEGHVEGGASGMAITKDFWDAMGEILFAGYIDTE